jgi:hypothetical protein
MADFHPTSDQYRRLAEGLLQSAIDAPIDEKQDLIRSALAYLSYSRSLDVQAIQPNQNGPTDDDEQRLDGYQQVRHKPERSTTCHPYLSHKRMIKTLS